MIKFQRHCLVIAIVMFLLCCYTVAQAAEDKEQHAIVSGIAGGMAVMVVDIVKPEWPSWKKWVVAGSLAMVPGIIKEATDDKFDWNDIAADAVGAYGGSAAMITLTIRW